MPASPLPDIHPRPQVSDRQPILVVAAAMWSELRDVINRLNLRSHSKQHYEGQVGQAKVVGLVTGIGHARAIGQLEQFRQRQCAPHALLWVGFAGGLDPAVLVGTVVRPRWLLNGQGESAELFATQPPRLSTDERLRPIVKRLLTQDQLIASVQAKRSLFDQYLAGSVDMESFHLANWAAQHQVPLAVVRIVTDPAEVALPVESLNWVRPDGRTNLWPVLGYIARKPAKIRLLSALRRQTSAAAKTLALEAQSWINQMTLQ